MGFNSVFKGLSHSESDTSSQCFQLGKSLKHEVNSQALYSIIQHHLYLWVWFQLRR